MSSQASPAQAAVTRPPALAATPQNAQAWTPHAALVRRRALAARTPASYRVRPGDSLSSVAARVYHDRSPLAGHLLAQPPADPVGEPDQRRPGAAHTGKACARARGARAPAGRRCRRPQATGSGPASIAAAYSGAVPGGAFGQCVIARESGGNAQIMNSTGHYGLYQFSAATWAAYGGNPADFGHASAAEQNQVFANALAAGGESNWAPYDGC